MKKTSLLLLTSLFNLTAIETASANFADIRGTYTGNISGTRTCTETLPIPGNSSFNEPDNDTLTVTIDTFDTNTGVFTGTGKSVDGGTASIGGILNSSGTVISSGYSGINEDGNTFVGTFDGSTFSSDTRSLNLQLSETVIEVIGPKTYSCVSTPNGLLSKISGGSTVIIDPRSTSSSTITANQTLTVQVQSISNDVGGRIGNVLRGNAVGGFQFNENNARLDGQADGLNAGDGMPVGFGAWASYSRSEMENDFVSTAFEGDRNTVLAGIDFMPFEQVVLGVALGYEFSDIDTNTNNGNVESDGYSVIPYAGLMLSNNFSMDFSLGYSNIDADQFRIDPVTNARVTSDTNTERYFHSFNLNGNWFKNNWGYGVSVGHLWARSDQNAFVEFDPVNGNLNVAEVRNRLKQVRVVGNLSYTLDNFEPYLNLNYNYDYSATEIVIIGGAQPSNDRDDVIMTTGFRFFHKDYLTGNLEYSKRFGRDDFDEDTVSASIRAEF